MKRSSIILMMVTIFSAIFGFARDIAISYFYGASGVSDAYLISITIPITIFGFVGTGLSIAYIPIFSKLAEQGGRRGQSEANKYTNNLINILICLSTLIILLGFIFTNQIVRLFASGLEGKSFLLAVNFTKINLFVIYFVGLISIFSGYLQIKGSFIVPSVLGFVLNFFVLLSIFFSHNFNIMFLAIGTVIGYFFQLLFLIPFAYKHGYKHRFIINFKDKNIRKMGYLALPVILGVSVDQINVLVDRTIASQITMGGITALNYAYRLNGFIQSIFVFSISTVIFPEISKLSATGDIMEIKKSLSKVINSINVFILPIMIGSMLFAKPIITILFGRGAFDEKAILMTSTALFYCSIGMLGFGHREILSRVFYSLQDTRTPVINAGIAMILNIILNILLSKVLGVGGLALATSISATFGTLLLLYSLKRKIGSLGLNKIVNEFIKLIIASLVMGILAKIVYKISNNMGTLISLVLAVCCGVIVYFFLLIILRVEISNDIYSKFKRKINLLVNRYSN